MKLIAISVGKILSGLCKMFHRGSTLPGKIALKLDKNLLKKFKYPSLKIVVTGSSGKGSTSSLIANTILSTNKTLCFNSQGANIDRGITSTLLSSSTLTGKIKADTLVLEMDERYTKKILPYLKPTYLIITNLTKDQPPRQHHIDLVYDDILKSIPEETTIITNMDDPFLRKYSLVLPNTFLYYSLSSNKYSYKNQIFENLNIYRCPKCQTPLKYNYYNFETLGSYYCPTCDFKYEEPKYLATSLNLDNETLTINNHKVNIGGDLLYNAYNTLASYACLSELQIPEEHIIEELNSLNKPKDHYFHRDNKSYRALSCKNENSTTFNQAIFKVINDPDLKDIIIGWHEISRRYNHFDISWLYDVEFELLNNKSLNKIYACGIDKDNIKERLILSGIPKNKIVTSSSIMEIKSKILKSKASKVYGILNFDYVKDFNEAFESEEEHEN